MKIRELTASDIETPEFWHLLWLACESDEATLRRVLNQLLARSTVLGTHGSDGDVIGFVAFAGAEQDIVIEYIATVETVRGKGVGKHLVRELQRLHPGATIVARTDDDAIGFYRSLGFVDRSAPGDARWPDRRRYHCVLHPEQFV